jgi:hypothetical protein
MNQPAITHQQALINLQQSQTPEGVAVLDYIDKLRKKDVAILGNDEVFTIRDGNSEVKAFKRKLVLSVGNGLTEIFAPGRGKVLTVSAQGYEMWAEATGTTVVFPKDVLVGGEWMPNPYVEKDPVNRRILTVYARAVALGFSAIGIKQASEWTTAFDTPSYRMIDLLAKAKDCPQAFKVLPKGMKPPESQENFIETWASYPFDESMDLWINTSHNEVIKWLGQIVNREKKSVDFAQTFAKRNALKHLSGIQKAPFDNWLIPVIAWRQTQGNNAWNISEYNEIQENITKVVEAENVEVKKGFERVSEEEVTDVEESEINPEDSQDTSVKTEQQEESQEKTELSKDVKQAMYLCENFPSQFGEAVTILNIDKTLSVAQYNNQTAVDVCKKISELLDQE